MTGLAKSLPRAFGLKLSNGTSIPQMQLGTLNTSPKDSRKAVKFAIQAGYRGFDTSQDFGNQKEVGSSILSFLESKGGIELDALRSDFHFQTKLSHRIGPKNVHKSLNNCLNTTGLGYVDLLFLQHSPYAKQRTLDFWRSIEDEIIAGRVRMGGVANFDIHSLKDLLSADLRVRPLVNQVEIHPFNARFELAEFCKSNGIAVQAQSPLAKGLHYGHPSIAAIARRHERTESQVLLRWNRQHGYGSLPKATRQSHLYENTRIDTFELSEEDMQILNGLDREIDVNKNLA